MTKTLELNEYITGLKDVKALIDLMCEDFALECITLENKGCKDSVINTIKGYIQNRGAQCIVESTGVSAYNRLYNMYRKD